MKVKSANKIVLDIYWRYSISTCFPQALTGSLAKNTPFHEPHGA